MFHVAHATVMLACLAAAPDESLFVTRPGPDGEAVVRVDPSRTGKPISRRLFGKFTEHLHRNIYHRWNEYIRVQMAFITRHRILNRQPNRQLQGRIHRSM